MLKFQLFYDLLSKKLKKNNRLALVSISQTDVTSFSQLSIKYKNFQNEPNPDPNPDPNPEPNPKPNHEPNPNQIEGKNHL